MLSEPRWQKSSYSETGGNNCVEVATLDDLSIGIRDSVRRDMTFSIERTAFTSFVRSVRSGIFGSWRGRAGRAGVRVRPPTPRAPWTRSSPSPPRGCRRTARSPGRGRRRGRAR
ncbi:DUF397 domain-containing protein [Streptomyces sp. AC512_CC834]|uniref:DUF397 domain-containing protein n=1 Tax=Streptomyces sp. AC512_CC834 TaxID=2823691 RepID=UPI001C25B28F|nr:DUF397 domain-containing protein [Streptomyces sp. AC512_CC834]